MKTKLRGVRSGEFRDRSRWSLALVGLVLTLLASNRAALADEKIEIPAWTLDARWYYIIVPRFHNGERANDPNNVHAWTASWLDETEEGKPPNTKQLTFRRYGGDLQGVLERLPYLKKLGVNTLILSSFFQGTLEGRAGSPDLQHVDPFVAVKGGYSEANAETGDPSTWKFSPSDRVFLDFLKRAHEEGFRVVASGLFGSFADKDSPLSQMEPYAQALARRWMDPDGDGDPSDGVDGWIHSFEELALVKLGAAERSAWRRLREFAHKTNPRAVLVGSGPLAAELRSEGAFDLVVDSNQPMVLERFFHPGTAAGTGKDFLSELEHSNAGTPVGIRNGGLVLLGSNEGPRLLTELSQPWSESRSPASPGPPPTDAAIDRWRLATLVQHLGPGAPVTFYGDEVGQFGGAGAFARAPMWWDDLTDSQTKSPHYRNDFFALIEWLHRTRAKYASLRLGTFRPVTSDDSRKVLTFARSLPGEEVIVVVNYGEAKQEVQVPAGRPGQLLALLSPQMKRAAPGSAPKRGKTVEDDKKLHVGGSRQFVNQDGTLTLWVGPMSARLILVNDAEPRR